MAKWNSIYIEGNIGKDPENFNNVVKFSIAVYTGKDKPPMWVPIVCFHDVGKTVMKEFTKGNSVIVEGSLNKREYESNGKKGIEWSVIADKVTERVWGGQKNKPKDDDFLEE